MEDTKDFLENLQTSNNPLKEQKGNKADNARSKNEWDVPSSSDKSKTYIVKRNINGSFSCTCPHHTYRKAECKHIKKVKESLKVVNFTEMVRCTNKSKEGGNNPELI